ncbi:unnamed protein product [Rotaria sp. Silwood1]|nr:unnamed protein product [Rotaria sp. Silwood1]CAF5024220.1 unnamed protein product [Rotaria sp. Silwood1]
MISGKFILPSIFFLISTASSYKKPVGGADGIYIFHMTSSTSNDPIIEYLGPANFTTTVLSGPSQRKDSGVHCEQNVFFSTDDMNKAISGLASFFGTGNAFYAKSVSSYYGSAVAFGCNYGNGQHMDANFFIQEQNLINNKCGSGRGGWSSHESWKSSYGRTSASKSFC